MTSDIQLCNRPDPTRTQILDLDLQKVHFKVRNLVAQFESRIARLQIASESSARFEIYIKGEKFKGRQKGGGLKRGVCRSLSFPFCPFFLSFFLPFFPFLGTLPDFFRDFPDFSVFSGIFPIVKGTQTMKCTL